MIDSGVVPGGIQGDGTVDGGVSYGLMGVPLTKVSPKIISKATCSPWVVYIPTPISRPGFPTLDFDVTWKPTPSNLTEFAGRYL